MKHKYPHTPDIHNELRESIFLTDEIMIYLTSEGLNLSFLDNINTAVALTKAVTTEVPLI